MRHYATWAFASTLALNRKYSVRAASRSQARRAQHRQAHRGSHCLSFVGLLLSHLSRSTEEANPPAGRVFLSAFSPKKPHSFPMGKPRFAPLPPRRIRLTPFPQSCHGFVLAPSSRQKPRQPRVSTNLLLWVGVTPPAQGSLVLANFAPEASPFSKGAKMPDLREPRTGSAPINSRSLPAVSLDRRLRKLPLRVFAVPAPLRGMVFQASEKLLRSAALRGRIFRVLESPRPVVEGFRL